MNKKQEINLSKKKVIGALAAGAASVYGQTQAEAGIQYTDRSANPIISDSTTTGPTPWDIDDDGGADVNFVNSSFGFSKKIQGNYFGFASSGGKLTPLAFSDDVKAANSVGNRGNFIIFNAGNIYANNVNVTSGDEVYFGFAMIKSGSVYYGWVEATLTNGGQYGTFEISRWAYNDEAGETITVGDTGPSGSTGAVPEPSSFAITGLGLLAAGAGGVRRWRREKKDKAA